MRFERLQPFGVVATDWALEDLSNPEQSARLVSEWHDAGGLLVLRGRLLEPEALVRVGQTFGEVENMVDTQMRPESIHEEVPEIFLVHNRNFSRAIPARPKDGDHVLQWPQRKGWHSDQSYRKPPPDASIIYCVRPGADGQGDTFFCDNAAAFDALSPAEQAEAARRSIIHAASSLGRSEQSVRKHPGVGAPPSGNGIEERIDFLEPQHQPVVRTHPVTGRRALYLGTSGQSDWLEGPVVGMEPGPDGAGGAWMGEHIHRATDPSRVYRHAWQAGDAVLYDNRVLMHAASWFDPKEQQREMWRLTVITPDGPGPEYADLAEKAPSWRRAKM